ncbi:MAG TPA: DUF177 domain-containing protein [Blastocatellia bacterium]|jgi:uncharacterized protein|nr:DUF177 domain-containing protein [Blastocatellia bacterium]
MDVNVSQISKYDGLTIQHVYAEGEPRLTGDESRIVGRATLNLHASRDGDKVRLVGSLTAAVEIDCDRCLALVSMPVDKTFDLLYIPPLKAEEEKELEDDDLSVAFYQRQVIDLDDLVREQIELTLPMGRLCREDCRGLCAECGTNLNEAECSCAANPADSPWGALGRLKFES